MTVAGVDAVVLRADFFTYFGEFPIIVGMFRATSWIRVRPDTAACRFTDFFFFKKMLSSNFSCPSNLYSFYLK